MWFMLHILRLWFVATDGKMILQHIQILFAQECFNECRCFRLPGSANTLPIASNMAICWKSFLVFNRSKDFFWTSIWVVQPWFVYLIFCGNTCRICMNQRGYPKQKPDNLSRSLWCWAMKKERDKVKVQQTTLVLWGVRNVTTPFSC